MSILLKFVSNKNVERRAEGSEFNIFIGHIFQQNTHEMLGLLEICLMYILEGAVQFSYTLTFKALLQLGHPSINFRNTCRISH